VKAYIIVSAVTCDAGELTGIGIPAHELMHMFFAIPDMYGIGAQQETQLNGARFWRTGCWDVMSAGSGWGCGAGPSADHLTPTHPNPWVRETVHWLRSDTISSADDTTITLGAVAAGGRTARFLVGPGEFFELEYRQRMGFDSNIPASGVLLYHVNSTRPRTPPTCLAFCFQPPILIEADSNNGLLRTLDEGGNRGEAGDAFGVAGRTTFSSIDTPSMIIPDPSATRLRILDVQIDEAAKVARVRVAY
jgi:immune inhibitor A